MLDKLASNVRQCTAGNFFSETAALGKMNWK
jgi:hypothetical protein